MCGVTALVMAGGAGTRMSRSGATRPKPLISAVGVSLLERNIHQLLKFGFDDITVAIPAGNAEISAFVLERCSVACGACGARLKILSEERPLGNIGCAGLLADRADTVLVVYADNLTSLNLRDVIAEHRRSRADMTIAAHREPFQMPFGELVIEDGRVASYKEKPIYRFPVCSAISVLGPAATSALPSHRPTGLSELVLALIESGRQVRAFEHAAPWVDVNDLRLLRRAEELIIAHPDAFELWAAKASPPERRVFFVADERGRILLDREDLPTALPIGAHSVGVSYRFDHVEPSGRIERWLIEYAASGRHELPAPWRFVCKESLAAEFGLNSAHLRALAVSEAAWHA